jgi:hypothetical protein
MADQKNKYKVKDHVRYYKGWSAKISTGHVESIKHLASSSPLYYLTDGGTIFETDIIGVEPKAKRRKLI